MEALTNNHFEKILYLFDDVKHSIKIIDLFISGLMAKNLCDVVKMEILIILLSLDFIWKICLQKPVA